MTWEEIMQAKVDEHWSVIVDCGWEDASLEDKFGLATNWDLMLGDD